MTKGPVCPCPECYRDWADEEINRLQWTVHNKDELIAAVWDVNKVYYERLRDSEKQRLMAEGRLEQIRLTWDMLQRNVSEDAIIDYKPLSRKV